MDVTQAGLCTSCVHCRMIRTRRSTFYMCRRSFHDERFPKYPRLPVVHCIGYERGEPDEGASVKNSVDKQR